MMRKRNADICIRQPLQVDEDLRSLLHQAGLRATAARIAVLRQLSLSLSPLTHAELLSNLPTLETDQSTVFRVLHDFVNCGLAKRMDLGDHSWRYEIAYSAETTQAGYTHPHLLCIGCGNITCLTRDEIHLQVSKTLGEIEEVLIRGRCPPCRAVYETEIGWISDS